jgi:hypothetical protein
VAGGLAGGVTDIELIRSRWERAEPFLDERGRRLLAANEALRDALGRAHAQRVDAVHSLAALSQFGSSIDYQSQMIALWETAFENMRRTCDTVRYENDPPAFGEYVARTEREAPVKAAMILLREIIDNPRMGPTIFDMQWSRVSLAGSRISLLTSDRPLDMPHGLGAAEAYGALGQRSAPSALRVVATIRPPL